MPLLRHADNYTRLNHFDGLFLQVSDFEVQRDYHVDVAQYLNYLLFDEGRLFEDDAVVPLDINVTDHIVEVTRGSAMVRHPLQPRAIELHLDSPVSFDMDDPTLTRFDGTPLQDGDGLMLAIEPAQRTHRVGTASLVPDDDRLVEQAAIVLRAPGDPPPTGPHHVLASLVHRTGATPTEFTSSNIRGGIRYQILSGLTRAALSAPGAGTLLTINVAPPTLSLNVAASQTLVATGNYSGGASQPLTAADGLAWSSDDTGIATVDAATGVVAGASVGSTTIRATVGTIEGTANVSVVSSVSPLIISASPPPFIGSRAGDTVTLEGTQIRDNGISSGQATGTNVLITSGGTTLTVIDSQIQVEPNALTGNQRISFAMPPRDAGWSPIEPVDLRVTLGGATSPLFNYRYRT